jgi:hypothetical protein
MLSAGKFKKKFPLADWFSGKNQKIFYKTRSYEFFFLCQIKLTCIYKSEKKFQPDFNLNI